MEKKLGGWSNPMPATEKMKVFSNMMKNITEAGTNQTYVEFVADEYKEQVVAGTNYLIRVHVGPDAYVHLMIFQSPLLEGTYTITFKGAKGGFKKDAHLNPKEITH